jgi:ribonuclease G
MASSAYLVIEHTEAMHVIDVNSGHKIGSSSAADDSILKVNLEATEEIARQLRLRDIGGLIIVDFIDMKNPEHKKEVLRAMRQAMKKDRAQHTVLPLSKFGLMQITRQRVRPEVKIDTTEICPTCSGTGKINAPILVIDEIARDLNFILQSRPKSRIKLVVHPFVESFLKKGFPNMQLKWYFKHLHWVAIKPDNNCHLTKYRFFDNNEDEIRLTN